MQFAKALRERVRSGEITKSIRIWKSARVTVGKRYKLDPGHIEVKSIHQICLDDITPRLARETGFSGVAELLKVAKHGKGENVYLVAFEYHSALADQ